MSDHAEYSRVRLETRFGTARYCLKIRRPNPVEQHTIPQIPLEDLALATRPGREGEDAMERLGTGTYAIVYRAELTQQQRSHPVAVKWFQPLDDDDYEDEDELVVREAQFIRHVHGTGYVPRLHGIVSGTHRDLIDGLSIVQDLFADGVTLEKVMMDFNKLPKNMRRHVAYNLAKGLKAIHGRGVLLNDIHDRNVLVDVKKPSMPVQFIDMGLATYGTTMNQFDENAKSFPHLAPEVRRGAWVTEASDVYSLGTIIEDLNIGVDDLSMKEATKICLNHDRYYRDLDTVIQLLDSNTSQQGALLSHRASSRLHQVAPTE